MFHIDQRLPVNNRQEEQLPPPLPPKTQHRGRTMALQAPQSRPPAPLPRPDYTLLDNVPLRQNYTAPALHYRNAVYEISAPEPGSLLKTQGFMQPPSRPAPVPPSSQERVRMPLPGEGTYQSLIQRRGLSKLSPFTADIKTERSGNLFQQLEIKTSGRLNMGNFIARTNHQRFGNIDTCAATRLFTPEGKPLPANQMKVDGLNLAMRSQYPKPEGLRDHLCMLADQKPGVLVVLSSDNDIANRHLPAYFRQNGQYDDVSVQCRINQKAHIATAGNLELRNYRIEITANGKTTPISVIHVKNWEDCTTIDPSTLKKLVSGINQKIEQKVGQDSGYNPQPFIHCSAGIGRTGVVAAAMEILKPDNKNMPEEIVLQLRETGSSKMVQTTEQFNTLVNLYKELKSES
ncbi:protein-tyrosine phosphatase family protein [Morganella morganii]|nr:hypothetical protein [Morganella morganii]